jgi:hypothetical protein
MTSEELIEKLNEMGLQPRAYSGRFMYGKYCVGVDVSAPGDYEWPAGWRMDNIGLDFIIYWPHVAWEKTMNKVWQQQTITLTIAISDTIDNPPEDWDWAELIDADKDIKLVDMDYTRLVTLTPEEVEEL